MRQFSAAFLLFALQPVLSHAQALRASAKFIWDESNTKHPLQSTNVTDTYIQSVYKNNLREYTTAGYCFYSKSDYTLLHSPDTPSGLDSHANCTDPLPLASDVGKILIKKADVYNGKCLSLSDDPSTVHDGSLVVISDCDYRYGNSRQNWIFDGTTLRQGNVCVDVTDGSNADGAKLQLWTCDSSNSNQQFAHTGGDVLAFPQDQISWSGSGKCVDLADGDETNGNQLQLWTCDETNSNQQWFLEVSYSTP